MTTPTNNDQTEDCMILWKIQDKLLIIGYESDERTSLNPELVHSLQTELSVHISKCDHPQCQKSFGARVNVGLQTKDGVYLK